MFEENITEPSRIPESDLNFNQILRFGSQPSCYIQLSDLQTSGDFVDSEFTYKTDFEMI